MQRALMTIALLVGSGCGGDSNAPEEITLPNGVYEVLATADESKQLPAATKQTRAVVFDQQFVRGGSEEPVQHVLLRLDGHAPLDLAEPPKAVDVEGRPALWITLKPAAGKALTALTARAQHVAVVIGGHITTTHTVREPLVGGKLQISC